MVDRPAWLFNTAPHGHTKTFVTVHYPLAFRVVGHAARDSLRVTTDTPIDDVSRADTIYMEKVLDLLTTGQTSRAIGNAARDRLATGSSRVTPDVQGGTQSSGRLCDLCELAHYTQWYAEFAWPFRFTILDCDACDVPISVLGEHRIDVGPDEVAFMEDALQLVAEQKYTGKFPKWMFDHTMRQIPDHYHFHVRPLLW